MLIIEIALGIVLAVVILQYWRALIHLGVLALIGGVVLAIVGIVSYLIYQNFDVISPMLSLTVLLGLLFGLWLLIKSSGEKLSVWTIEKWDLSSGDIFGLLWMGLMLFTGAFMIVKTLVNGDYLNIMFTGGVFLLIIGAIISKVHIKEINRSKSVRAIKSTYDE